MRPSRRSLARSNQWLSDRNQKLASDLEEAESTATACTRQLERATGELSRAKDVIASHILAAGRPDTVLHDVRTFAESLRQALTDSGVDLRVELHRLEGGDL